MCWRPQTSGYSYPKVTTIRIDVHPVGETRPTLHMHPKLTPCIVPYHTYLTWWTHSNLSRSYQQHWTNPLLPRKRAPNTSHNTLAGWSTGPYPIYLPRQPLKQGGKATLCWRQATRLIGPISPACDWYVQYLLVGANPLVLNRHRQGLQPSRCRLSTYHSTTFPADGPPLFT
jgi:hypothetical protein